MIRRYQDFCRPSHPVVRTEKQPGDLVLTVRGVEHAPTPIVHGDTVVAMRRLEKRRQATGVIS